MIKKILTYTLVMLPVAYLLFNIVNHWNAVVLYPWKIQLIDIVLFIPILFFVFFLNLIIWHLILKSMDINLSFDKSAYIWLFANINRFIPGGVWQFPSRVYLLSKRGINKTLGTTALIIEVAVNLLISSSLAFLAVLSLRLPFDNQLILAIFLIFFLLICSLTILGNKKVLFVFADLIGKINKKALIIKKVKIPVKTLPLFMVLFILQNIFAGVVLYFLVNSAVFVPLSNLPVFIGIFCASWLIGYVAFFAPSGLGIQEASMAGLLSLYVPIEIAAIIAISLRIVLLIPEMIFVMLFLFKVDIDS